MPKKPNAPMITLSANAFFTMLRDASYDRPSAFFEYARHAGVKKPLRLLMHAEYHKVYFDNQEDGRKIVAEERAYLAKVFGGENRIPKVLLSSEWDT